MNNNLLVTKGMPALSELALTRFVAINQRQNGIDWATALDLLIDSDSHLDVTEPVYEALIGTAIAPEDRGLIGPITVTLLYALHDRGMEHIHPDLVRSFVYLIGKAREVLERQS